MADTSRIADMKKGKRIEDLEVPEYWPDTDVVRSNIVVDAFETEWFDTQLYRMLDLLDDVGELDNTVVVVTPDKGMPFPRVKGQMYEDDFYLSLRSVGAIRGSRGVLSRTL